MLGASWVDEHSIAALAAQGNQLLHALLLTANRSSIGMVCGLNAPEPSRLARFKGNLRIGVGWDPLLELFCMTCHWFRQYAGVTRPSTSEVLGAGGGLPYCLGLLAPEQAKG